MDQVHFWTPAIAHFAVYVSLYHLVRVPEERWLCHWQIEQRSTCSRAVLRVRCFMRWRERQNGPYPVITNALWFYQPPWIAVSHTEFTHACSHLFLLGFPETAQQSYYQHSAPAEGRGSCIMIHDTLRPDEIFYRKTWENDPAVTCPPTSLVSAQATHSAPLHRPGSNAEIIRWFRHYLCRRVLRTNSEWSERPTVWRKIIWCF